MIDFIKIQIFDEALINQVWNNDLLLYDGKSEKRYQDELKELFRKKFNNLFFTKYLNRLEISGSLHYYYNDGGHNANDFHYNNFLNVIDEIKSLFKLDLEKCKVVNLEYGVNVSPFYDVNNIVCNLIYHEKRQFIRPTRY